MPENNIEKNETQELEENTPVPSALKPAPSSKPTFVLLLFIIIPLLGILAAIFMVLSENQTPVPTQERTSRDDEIVKESLMNYAAPGFELPTLEGELLSLSDLKGQSILINFWQTTCGPCVRELPALNDFAETQGEDGVKIIAINFGESAEKVQTFLSEIGLEKPHFTIVLDNESTIQRTYGVQGIPTTYAVDKEGIVRYLKLGEMSFEDIENYAEQIQ
ncbi:redoxin domain-containing protein [Anaerolineales bacterium]